MVAYCNWSKLVNNDAGQTDVIENPAVIDERVHLYKGVHNRMGQGDMNDYFYNVEADDQRDILFNERRLENEYNNTWKPPPEDEQRRQKIRQDEAGIEETYKKKYPYCVIVERVNEKCEDYLEQKKFWRRDAAHFDFKKACKTIDEEKNFRDLIHHTLGIKNEYVEHRIDHILQNMQEFNDAND